jgi:alkanesulfonate monooxygenase SsuD/methylene tetrahydromethanopterin reductase-like flavin-dependent oxidoreductase (luciferase family)
VLRVLTEPQQGGSYQQLLNIAQVAESLQFAAFFRSDHYLRMDGVDPHPTMTDAWITLAGLARETTTIRLGTLVTPVTFRPLGTLPIAAAQVDHMSGGRLEIGLGAGWFEAEHKAFGLTFPPLTDRYDLLRDQLAIFHGAWSSPQNSIFQYKGQTCDVDIDPDTVRPLQLPRPPIILGGKGGPRSLHLAASYADEYNISFVTPDAVRIVRDRLTKACLGVGRDPASLFLSVGQTLCCGRSRSEVSRRAKACREELVDLQERGLTGSPEDVLTKLWQLADCGADRFYLQLRDMCDPDHLVLIADEVLKQAPGQ